MAWIALILGGVLLYAIWSALRAPWPIRIEVDRTGVRSHEGLPKARVATVVEFFEQDVRTDEGLVVLAARLPDGRLRTKFIGKLDPGTKQRIRNFLIAEM